MYTNFSLAGRGGGQVGGRGGEGGGSANHIATCRGGKATKSSHIEPIPCHKAKEASS